MKTFEINHGENSHFITTDAGKMDVQSAIDFMKRGGAETSIDKLLQALRILGFKAREVKVQAEEVFDL